MSYDNIDELCDVDLYIDYIAETLEIKHEYDVHDKMLNIINNCKLFENTIKTFNFDNFERYNQYDDNIPLYSKFEYNAFKYPEKNKDNYNNITYPSDFVNAINYNLKSYYNSNIFNISNTTSISDDETTTNVDNDIFYYFERCINEIINEIFSYYDNIIKDNKIKYQRCTLYKCVVYIYIINYISSFYTENIKQIYETKLNDSFKIYENKKTVPLIMIVGNVYKTINKFDTLYNLNKKDVIYYVQNIKNFTEYLNILCKYSVKYHEEKNRKAIKIDYVEDKIKSTYTLIINIIYNNYIEPLIDYVLNTFYNTNDNNFKEYSIYTKYLNTTNYKACLCLLFIIINSKFNNTNIKKLLFNKYNEILFDLFYGLCETNILKKLTGKNRNKRNIKRYIKIFVNLYNEQLITKTQLFKALDSINNTYTNININYDRDNIPDVIENIKKFLDNITININSSIEEQIYNDIVFDLTLDYKEKIDDLYKTMFKNQTINYIAHNKTVVLDLSMVDILKKIYLLRKQVYEKNGYTRYMAYINSVINNVVIYKDDLFKEYNIKKVKNNIHNINLKIFNNSTKAYSFKTPNDIIIDPDLIQLLEEYFVKTVMEQLLIDSKNINKILDKGYKLWIYVYNTVYKDYEVCLSFIGENRRMFDEIIEKSLQNNELEYLTYCNTVEHNHDYKISSISKIYNNIIGFMNNFYEEYLSIIHENIQKDLENKKTFDHIIQLYNVLIIDVIINIMRTPPSYNVVFNSICYFINKYLMLYNPHEHKNRFNELVILKNDIEYFKDFRNIFNLLSYIIPFTDRFIVNNVIKFNFDYEYIRNQLNSKELNFENMYTFIINTFFRKMRDNLYNFDIETQTVYKNNDIDNPLYKKLIENKSIKETLFENVMYSQYNIFYDMLAYMFG